MSYRYLPIGSESDSDQPVQEGRVVPAKFNRQSMTDSSLAYARFQNENGEGVPADHMIEPFQMSDIRSADGATAQVNFVTTSNVTRGEHYPQDSTAYLGVDSTPRADGSKPVLDDPSRRQYSYRRGTSLPHESVFGDLRDDAHLVPESDHRSGRSWNFTFLLDRILRTIDPCEALHLYAQCSD